MNFPYLDVFSPDTAVKLGDWILDIWIFSFVFDNEGNILNIGSDLWDFEKIKDNFEVEFRDNTDSTICQYTFVLQNTNKLDMRG